MCMFAKSNINAWRAFYISQASGVSESSRRESFSVSRCAENAPATKMINESMLTKEQKPWIKDHDQQCLQMLAPGLVSAR
uniref:Uncharacterized protein n=1 Tax=Mycena chlorophos TaxID=658473 RepID=A0ABQ0LAM8_MYCCL|nr:predicted protein [Mycena chlorophos]